MAAEPCLAPPRADAAEPPHEREAADHGLRAARWRLVQRVATSPEFARAPRLRALLLYACERTLAQPSSPAREADVAAALFGRASGTRDTIVRVHACRLRKRLARYFSARGAAEPVWIEMPVQGYTPVFRPRPAAGAEPSPAGPRRLPRAVVTWGLSAAALATLAVAGGTPREPAAAPSGVERLWRQMFGTAANVAVVVADSNLSMLEELLGRQLTLAEYQARAFDVRWTVVPRGPPPCSSSA
jgi:hypothetical protein